MTKEATSIEARYRRASRFIQGMFTTKLVQNDILFPHWIEDSECFWYERMLKGGKQYRLVDAQAFTNKTAFDHDALAKCLSERVGCDINPDNLPINQVEISLTSFEVLFNAFDKRWVFDQQRNSCLEIEAIPENWVISPDSTKAVFTRNFNLWLRDMMSGDERALTEDGEENLVYAVEGENYGHSTDALGKRAQAIWSPDGKKIFTVLRDTSDVETLPVVQHVPLDGSMRPKFIDYKIALPGDANIPTYQLVIIDLEIGKVIKLDYPAIPVLNNGRGYFSVSMGWWSADSQKAYFIDQDRDYRAVRILENDMSTGRTRVLFSEESETNISLAPSIFETPAFMPLPNTNELIWWSERTGWGQLYLYDLDTGAMKHVLTKGDWLIREVLHFDPKRRELFVQTAGRIASRDPYYRDLCRINIDTKEIITLVSGDCDHFVSYQESYTVREAKHWGHDVEKTMGISPTGNFAIVTASRADSEPVTYLYDRQGLELLEVERANISDLPVGWRWPEPVKLKASDGKTDIYGLIYRPSKFNQENSYPVLVCGYHCEGHPIVPKGSFSNGSWTFGAAYFYGAALAELGFVVVQIDGRGTPHRSKIFMDSGYGWDHIASDLTDEVCGIKQLCDRYPYMDFDRVGTISPMAGPGPVWALLKHPDVYSVGVTGEHYDYRLTPTILGEKFGGAFDVAVTQEFPEYFAANLKGKLLLTSGMLNPGNIVACTFRLVDALQRANKDFDMILLPQGHHCAGNYQLRRAWDYLVKYLLGEEPPKEFELIADVDVSQFVLKTDAKARA